MLGTFAVHEKSSNEGLHVHLLVGVPEHSLKAKAISCKVSPPDLIISEWVGADHKGVRRANAQDAREITNFDGVLGYVTKTISQIGGVDAVDVLNTTYPSDLILPPA